MSRVRRKNRKPRWKLPSNKKYQTGRLKARIAYCERNSNGGARDRLQAILNRGPRGSFPLIANQELDLISQIVDRDTPPDNRDEVVDCHANGVPITRGDVARTNQFVAR